MTNARRPPETVTGSMPPGLMELSSSMVRLFIAMGALGAQQATHFLRSRPPAETAIVATPPFDSVANAVEEQFGGVFRGVYRIGRQFF